MSAAGPAKVCVLCQQDVTTRKRMKDSAGRYYCEACYAKRVAAQRPVAAPPPPTQPPPPPAPDPVDDTLTLSAPLDPPSGNLLGCSGCKKLFPEAQVANIDGTFLCRACHAKHGGFMGKLRGLIRRK